MTSWALILEFQLQYYWDNANDHLTEDVIEAALGILAIISS